MPLARWLLSSPSVCSPSLSSGRSLPTDRAPASAVSSIEKAEESLGREAELGRSRREGVQSTYGGARHLLSGLVSSRVKSLLSLSRALPPPCGLVHPRSARVEAATRRIPAVEPVFGARVAQAETRESSRCGLPRFRAETSERESRRWWRRGFSFFFRTFRYLFSRFSLSSLSRSHSPTFG